MNPEEEFRLDEIDALLIDRALFGQGSLSPEELEKLAAFAAKSPEAAAQWEELASLVLASAAAPTEPSSSTGEAELLAAGWEERLNARFDREVQASGNETSVNQAHVRADQREQTIATAAERGATRVQQASQIQAAGSAEVGVPTAGSLAPAASRNRAAQTPWVVSLVMSTAAAFVGGWFIGSWNQPESSEQPPVVAAKSWGERYLELKELPTSTLVEWKGNDQGEIAGFVVWNDELQEGFMAFETLAANDPAIEQYQLWIFDAARSDDHPVDGGVFNIAQDNAFLLDGLTLVPIDAKLPVSHAKMFALTVEAPGGVVVSSREKLPGLAVVP